MYKTTNNQKNRTCHISTFRQNHKFRYNYSPTLYRIIVSHKFCTQYYTNLTPNPTNPVQDYSQSQILYMIQHESNPNPNRVTKPVITMTRQPCLIYIFYLGKMYLHTGLNFSTVDKSRLNFYFWPLNVTLEVAYIHGWIYLIYKNIKSRHNASKMTFLPTLSFFMLRKRGTLWVD